MSRRIQTTQLQGAGVTVKPDAYADRLIKYIPADVVGAWLAADGAIRASDNTPTTVLLWISFLFLLLLTPLWIFRQTKEAHKPPAMTQALIATGSFAVWVFAIGGPFARYSFYRPLYATLLLIGYSLVVAAVIPKEA